MMESTEFESGADQAAELILPEELFAGEQEATYSAADDFESALFEVDQPTMAVMTEEAAVPDVEGAVEAELPPPAFFTPQEIGQELSTLAALYPDVHELPATAQDWIRHGMPAALAYQNYLLGEQEVLLRDLKQGKVAAPPAEPEQDAFLCGFWQA